jgi:hypothetical protein
MGPARAPQERRPVSKDRLRSHSTDTNHSHKNPGPDLVI